MKKLPIRIKLFIAFLIVAIVASLHTLVQHYYTKKVSEVGEFMRAVESLNTTVLKGQMYKSNFIMNDLIKPSFYINETSQNLYDLKQTTASQLDQIEVLRSKSFAKKGTISERLDSLYFLVDVLSDEFDILAETSLKLGFEDFGLVGEMRAIAHELEKEFSDIIPMREILMLRRHEKDFIIRKNLKYRDRFNDHTEVLRAKLKADINDPDTKNCLLLLNRYQQAFNLICNHNEYLGLNSEETGLKGSILKHTDSILNQNSELNIQVQKIAAIDLRNLRTVFVISLLLTTVVTVLVVFRLSTLMSRSIRGLSHSIQDFVKSGFAQNLELSQYEDRRDEIGDLYKNFKILSDEVTVHFKEYRKNAESKHKEIVLKNKKINEQKLLLEERQRLLSKRNGSLMDSIMYAKRIQTALFPTGKILREIFGDHILVFKPKDVVSGDFYWVHERGNSIYFAVGDCTGHGVPGAFMSILAFNQLNYAMKQHQLTKPGQILGYLDKNIKSLLNRDGATETVHDGMDIILCRYLIDEERFEFASANRPLLAMRNREIERLTGNRTSIGGLIKENERVFKNVSFAADKYDLLFLTTDGYSDQFGGRMDKKLKNSGFLANLKSVNHFNLKDSQTMLLRNFSKWKGDKEQVDDVCVLGILTDKLINMHESKFTRHESKIETL
jgi:serine phosphatase RsbU (regulator of sigma subunit)